MHSALGTVQSDMFHSIAASSASPSRKKKVATASKFGQPTGAPFRQHKSTALGHSDRPWDVERGDDRLAGPSPRSAGLVTFHLPGLAEVVPEAAIAASLDHRRDLADLVRGRRLGRDLVAQHRYMEIPPGRPPRVP